MFKVFLQKSQNSPENTRVEVSCLLKLDLKPATLLKRRL